MDDTTLITVLIALVSALGVKEIWNIWKKNIDNKNTKSTKDEITKDTLTAQVIEELKDKIGELEIKIDKLIKDNVDCSTKLARMEERLIQNAKSNSTRKIAKSKNKTQKS